MKLLWITNTIFPAPCKALNLPNPVYGGWMYGLAKKIGAIPGIRLSIATIYKGDVLRKIEIEDITYYLIPSKSTTIYRKKLEGYWKTICNDINPEIIHIHGTEYTHGLACMNSCPNMNYVISIQGMVSVYARYYYANINTLDILLNLTLRDVYRFDSIFQGKRKFEKRGQFEKEYLLKSKHVVGRTNWDFAHTKAINPSLNYHFCNEILRDFFYIASKWNIRSKVSHTIFLSQGSLPIKGLHLVLKSIFMLRDEFPNIKLRIAGTDIVKRDNLIDKFKLSGYGSYLISLINKYKIEENVHFIGTLFEEQIVREYQNAHIFICPSSIENSPNSLGEAQIIGVPTIASYVGGVPDMITHQIDGLLYRFDDAEMLTQLIRDVFLDDVLATSLSLNGIISSTKRHDSQINIAETYKIYKKISNQVE